MGDETEERDRPPTLDEVEALAGVGSYAWNLATGEIRWSKNLFVLLGYAPGSVTPGLETFRKALAPDDAAEIMARLERDARAGNTEPFTYRVVAPEGGFRHVRSTACFLRNAEGALVQMRGTIRDVTETMRSEGSLRESNALLAFVQELAHIGTWIFDLATGVLTWSDELFRIHGFEPQAFAPTFELAPTLVHPDDRATMERVSAELTADGRTGRIQYRVVRPSGEARTVIACAAFQAGPSGSRHLLIGTVLDVTDSRNLEGLLAHAQRMEAIGRLAGGVAHDFNNLLASMVLSLALVRQKMSKDAAATHAGLRDIEDAAERATALTRQLLAFARRQPIEPRVVRLDAIALSVDGLLRRLAGQGVETRLASEPGLGLVKADPSQVEQILVNLVVNARDAMPSGTGVISITLRNTTVEEGHVRKHPDAALGAHVVLEVRDTGSGIDPAVMAHIFEPFFTTKKAGEGTGLGLATCYGIVRQAGGHITVESERGVGTCFRVYLPRTFDHVAPEPARAEGDAVARGESLLVVDDEEPIRRATVELLERAGYLVFVAVDGADALAVLDANPVISLLVTDVVMPNIDGIALVKLARARRPRLRVLLVSGYVPATAENSGWRGKGPPLLGKPFTNAQLLARVRLSLDEALDDEGDPLQ